MKIKRMRYSRKRIFLGLFLFLVLLGLGVGFAFVTTKLSIEGVANVKDAKWDIHFDNFEAISGSVTPTAEPSVTDTTITFSAKVNEPGDFYGFTFDVVNEGTINAELADFSVTPDFSQINYIDSTIEYTNGNQIAVGDLLPANKSKKVKVLLSYKDGIDESLYPTTDQSFNVTITLKYQQYIGEVPVWVLPEGKTKDNLSLGDEICINEDVGSSDQCFNFIKYNGNDVVMFAKYNLNAGENPKVSQTKIQDSSVRGYYSGMTKYGNVEFSQARYWYDQTTNALKPKYGSSYPANVYDEQYSTEPDFSGSGYSTVDYSVAYYVKEYKNILTSYGATIKDARLLTYSEATDSSIGCSSGSLCPTGFIRNTSFWLGTAADDGSLWTILSTGVFTTTYHDYNNYFGIRPVIVVEKSDL